MSDDVGELHRLVTGDAATLRQCALLAMRVAPVASFAPWLSALGISPLVRVAIAATLSLAFLPLSHVSPACAEPFALAMLLELLRGAVFLAGVTLPWFALDTTFGLVDAARLRGASAGDTPNGLPAMSALLFVAVFAAAGGFNVLVEGFAASLHAVPLGAVAEKAQLDAVAMSALRALSDAIAFGVRLAVPVLLGLVFVEIGVAAISRASNSAAVAAAAAPVLPAAVFAAFCLVLARSGPALVALVRGSLALAVRWLAPA